jgi:hypothetical protein
MSDRENVYATGARPQDLRTFTNEELERMLPEAGLSNPYPLEWIEEELRLRAQRVSR